MKQPLIQALVIIAIIAVMFIAFLLRSFLGLTTPESLGALSQIVTLFLLFMVFNFIADLIFKPADEKNHMAIYIGCAALSALIIMIFHDAVQKDWMRLFWLLFGKPDATVT